MAVANHVLDMGRRVNIDMEKGQVIGERKLRDSGNSTVLTIPPEILDVADLEAGDEIEITADMGTGKIEIVKKTGGDETESEDDSAD